MGQDREPAPGKPLGPGARKDLEHRAPSGICPGPARLVSFTVTLFISRGTWVAPSVECLTLDFGSGHDLRVLMLSPAWALGSMILGEST